MKRLIVLSAVLVPLALAIAGCGDGGGSSSPSAEKTKANVQKGMMEQMQQKMKSGGTPGAQK
jgi:predicted small lipoprotein YifL